MSFSDLGSYMWMLSFSLQYIIDEIDQERRPSAFVARMKELMMQFYEEVAQSCEMLSDNL